MNRFLAFALLFCAVAFSQGATSTVDGSVTDPQGAAVPGARIEVTNISTGQVLKAETDERGHWALPSMQAATYRVTVTKPGFKVGGVNDVVVNAGVPATVNTKLELGQSSEIVEVQAGAEMAQTSNAAISSTLTGRQLTDLPFATRNAVELLVTQPGTQTPTTPRSSTVNGLPKGALNVTIDGLNSQDNLLKSSDGFFSNIYTPVDAMEELTLTTSAGGVDSTSQGAAQIKFITRSGTNQFHGGLFWQVRNTAFDANYYFNNQTGLPRDIIKLNQGGFHVGGPIKKDKLFFFTNYEVYRLPGTKTYTRTILTDPARNGLFTYQDANKQVHSINLYQLAGAANANLPAGTRPFPTTPDPILAQTFSQIASLSANGVLRSNVATNNDYNRQTLSYQPTGTDSRDFFTTRLDYNINSNHQLSFVYNYDKYDAVPDFLNNVVAAFPGTGTVLGSNVDTGQRSNRFSGVLSLRSVLTPRLTNEVRTGLTGGTVLFFDAVGSPALFSQWLGYQPTFGNTTTTTYLSGVTTTTNSQRRNSPLKTFSDTLSWVKGAHQLSFGGNFDSVNLFNEVVSTSVLPRIGFGIASGDPIATGNTNIFNTANFPGASSAQLTDAENLYASLTGRVNTITRQVALSETDHTYGQVPAIDRDRIREYGLFAQDTWRVRPSLTVNVGLRYEKQLPFVNISNTYTRVGIQGVWGLSGVGNLFEPGNLPGVVPTFQPANSVPNAYSIPAVWAPSIGIAWQAPGRDGLLGWLFGRHPGASVFRLGYSIATIREGSNVFTSIWGSNQGLNIDASVSAGTTPGDFGAPGSVLFRDGVFPTRSGVPAQPVYPIPASFTSSVNEFDPNLKMGYVESWNLGFQRELGKDTVVELRYTGNHGVDEWRQYNINEVNIFENGFLSEFKIAANNLAINRRTSPNSNNFGNLGLPGQQNTPILQAALGTTNDVTTAGYLVLGQAGTAANAIATNAARMNNLVKAGFPANLFVANPTVAGGGAFILNNTGSSYYDALQLEFRRRFSRGFTLQGSYAFGKALANGATNSAVDSLQPTTLRNLSIDKVPEPFDIRHAIKINSIYELPFGPGREFLGGVQNVVARKLLEGWEIAGVARLQSGTPFFLNGLGTFDQVTSNTGVVLHNMTAQQLQDMSGIYKTTGSDGKGIVYYLPQNVIQNTLAAFGVGGRSPSQVDPTAPYISPAAPGQLGWRGYFYDPWQRHFDVSLVKITKFGERANLELRAQALDVFNLTNFIPDNVNNNTNSSTFGQLTQAYRDISGTVDPGARILEFVVRVNF